MRQSGLRLSGTIVLALLLNVVLNGCGTGLTDSEHLERAKSFHEKGDTQSSIIELKNALQKNPQNADARWILGRTYVELHQGASAEPELRRAIDLGVPRDQVLPSLAEALLLQRKYEELLGSVFVLETYTEQDQAALHVLRGQAYLDVQNLDAARQEFDEALHVSPDSPATWFGQALLAVQVRDWGGARQWLDRILEVSPRHSRARALKGDIAIAHEDFAAAKSEYEALVGAVPGNLDYRMSLASALLNLNEPDEALRHLNVVLRAAPHAPQPNFMRAAASYQKRDYADAKAAAERALANARDHLPSRLVAGASSYHLGQYEAASRHLTAVVNRAPHFDPARLLLSMVQLQLGLHADAVATARSVANPSVDDAVLFSAIGVVAVRAGDPRSRREMFERAVDLRPEFAGPRAQLGLVQVMMGEHDEGIQDLQKAIEIEPDLHAVEFAVVLSYLRSGDFDNALDTANRLSDRMPANAGPLNLIGLAHLGRGEQELAQQAFQQAFELLPGNPVSAQQLARLALNEGRVARARELYSSVLTGNPGHVSTRVLLSQLEVAEGDLEAAKGHLETAVQRNPDSLQPRILLSRYHQRTGRPLESVRLLEEGAEVHSDDPVFLAELANAQLAASQPTKAVTTARRLVEVSPNADSHHILAQVYAHTQNISRMRRELDRALGLDPDHLGAQIARVRLLMIDGRLDDAGRQLKNLKQTQPAHPDVLAQEGELAMARNEPQEAIPAFEGALERAPSSRRAMRLAQAYAQAGDVEGVLITLETWVKRVPADTQAWSVLARAYLALNRPAEAAQAYERVLDQSPNAVLALNNLALLLREKDPHKALGYAERALEAAPDSASVMYTTGVLLLDTEQQDARALVLLRDAVQRAPTDLDMRYYLAVALLRTGEVAAAREVLNELLGQATPFDTRLQAELLLEKVD